MRYFFDMRGACARDRRQRIHVLCVYLPVSLSLCWRASAKERNSRSPKKRINETQVEDEALWLVVVTPDFELTLPPTPYRDFPSAELSAPHLRSAHRRRLWLGRELSSLERDDARRA